MAIKLRSTSEVHTNGIKMLVYGAAGAGKTHLIQTLPNPVILSAESGLLTLQGKDIPYIQITNMAELHEAYAWAVSDDCKFDSICLDSISEIAEVVLNTEKKKATDPRQAYGAMQEQVSDIIRAFRDIPGKHVYFSAKQEKTQDDMGRIIYGPMMPGKQIGQQIPYQFDMVFALRVEKDSEGNAVRALLCERDGLWEAKNRGGRLDTWEAPDLGEIIKKVSS